MSIAITYRRAFAMGLMACASSWTQHAVAAAYSFSTGDPDGKMAMASRPSSAGQFEIETADDFVLTDATQITGASFTGLLSADVIPSLAPSDLASGVASVVVEIYRVFPQDSDVTRTPNVPTRVNSPSDVAFDSRDSAGGLSFSTNLLNPTFTSANSVRSGGIHAKPNQSTGGNGAVTGEEVRFDVNFTTPLNLPAGHYFFVPQVGLSTGNFYWLSAPKPIVAPGTPFTPDLQAWTRDASLDPDWLRVGTDIVSASPAPTFNASFSLSGSVVPEPQTYGLMLAGLGTVAMWSRRRRCVTTAG